MNVESGPPPAGRAAAGSVPDVAGEAWPASGGAARRRLAKAEANPVGMGVLEPGTFVKCDRRSRRRRGSRVPVGTIGRRPLRPGPESTGKCRSVGVPPQDRPVPGEQGPRILADRLPDV